MFPHPPRPISTSLATQSLPKSTRTVNLKPTRLTLATRAYAGLTETRKISEPKLPRFCDVSTIILLPLAAPPFPPFASSPPPTPSPIPDDVIHPRRHPLPLPCRLASVSPCTRALSLSLAFLRRGLGVARGCPSRLTEGRRMSSGTRHNALRAAV